MDYTCKHCLTRATLTTAVVNVWTGCFGQLVWTENSCQLSASVAVVVAAAAVVVVVAPSDF